GMADAGQGIDSFFDEIVSLSEGCQYADCTHTHEPGCAVLEAVKSGRLDKDKYGNYVNLKKEAEHFEMDDIEKREKDRRFGKFKKNAMKELKDSGRKDL
ncbi:MAG: ribosome small subunit-dependent GTPase A, partial [Patescibacteria group bacterium]|nr:ribosome small subunit-dependent GTPase A [Patescibacteria group bacterium]